jgi:hypothetical protein
MVEPGKNTKEPRKDAAAGNARFAAQKDERLNSDKSYGAGIKDNRNPAPSTMPSSTQTDRAKPIKR